MDEATPRLLLRAPDGIHQLVFCSRDGAPLHGKGLGRGSLLVLEGLDRA